MFDVMYQQSGGLGVLESDLLLRLVEAEGVPERVAREWLHLSLESWLGESGGRLKPLSDLGGGDEKLGGEGAS